MYQKVFRRRLEGNHYVMRWVDTYDIYALRILAESYDTKRAESVAKRCADIMLKNLECDYSDIIQHFID